MKKFFLYIACLLFMVQPAFSKMVCGEWHNDLRTLFNNNNAIIYTINIRTFNAKDTNKNDLIDEDEERGNFLNAIDNLDELVKEGINTIHLLPITPIGKIKALGTAGSLYGISDFENINPQMLATGTSMNGRHQAKRFISECHKRNIRVIVDLPSCGSYDLFVEHPEYFLKDENGKPIVPLDWSDVRLLNYGTQLAVNEEMMKVHKKFVDMLIEIGADGIRADVAGLKQPLFWSELINYARSKNDEFLFLAESSRSWTEPVAKQAFATPSEELLKAGFDGYLGSYFNLKNWKTGKELITNVQEDLKLFKKLGNTKSVIGSFATHDELSPILVNGSNFSKMIIWLNTTLPLNPYYVDGFSTGDNYTYKYANQVATKSYTDDEYYFVHNGKIDIFNFSRKPGGSDYSIYEEFILANKFKQHYSTELGKAKFIPLKNTNPKIFSYARSGNNFSVIVIGNLDFENPQTTVVKVSKLKENTRIINIRVQNKLDDEYLKGKIKANLKAGEIQVLLIKNMVL